MSRIITYKEQRYSMVQLDSGEKVMISITQDGVTIFAMRFGGLLPGRKLAEWSIFDLEHFLDRLGGQPPPGSSAFRHAVNNMTEYPSIAALEAYLA
ncbi:MAG: hypothetical protein QOJ45_117 [Verrucomicrobiota bacterium]|jgi:hypothetical protein